MSEPMSATLPRTGTAHPQRAVAIAVAVWVVGVLSATAMFLSYEFKPGERGTVQNVWPADAHVTRDSALATLILGVHPQCPCTEATLTELSRIMTRCRGRVVARVLFIKPMNLPDGWATTKRFEAAAAIPGVSAEIDVDGVDCARFGISTSGDVRLFDPSGALLFSGGITESRGHAGDNAGEDAIVAALESGDNAPRSTPVFGCPLK